MVQPFFAAAVAGARRLTAPSVAGAASGALGTITLTAPTGTGAGTVAPSYATKTLMVSESTQDFNDQNTANYGEVVGRWRNRTANENRSQMRAARGGTFRNIRVFVQSNARTTATTVTLRVNGAASAVSCTIPAGTSGWISGSGSAAVAAGDLFNYVCQTGGGGFQSLVITRVIIEYEASLATTFYVRNGLDTAPLQSASTQYTAPHGYNRATIWGWGTNGTQGEDANMFGCSGQLSHLRLRVITNTFNAAAVLTLFKNGSATALTLTIPAGAGAQVYTVDGTSVTVAPGDVLQWRMTATGRTSGDLTFGLLELMFTSSDGTWDLLSRGQDSQDAGGTGGAANYLPVGGQVVAPATSETARTLKLPFAAEISRITLYSAYNSGSNNAVWSLAVRVNGVTSDLAVPVPLNAFNPATQTTKFDDSPTVQAASESLVGVTYTPGSSFSPGPQSYGVTMRSLA